MKNKRNHMKMIILAAILTAGSWAKAQTKTLTLKDCIETGIKNNLDVMQSNLEAEVARANWQQAKANFYPDLNGNITHGKNQGRSIDPFTNQYINQNVNFANYSLNSGVILFNGLRLINTLKQRSLGLKASEMDLQQQKDDLTIRILLTYLQVLRNQEQLVQARNQATLSERQVERLTELDKQGAIAPALLTDLQGDLATNQLTIYDVANSVETSKIELARLMNVPYQKNTELEPLDPSMFNLEYGTTSEQIYATALERFADVKASEFRLASASKGVKAARGNLWPELSLNGNVSTNYSSAAFQNIFVNTTEETTTSYVNFNGIKSPVIQPQDNYQSEQLKFKQQFDNNLFSSFNLNLRIPIFNALQARTQVKLASIQQKNTEYQLTTVKVQLQQSIEQAYLNMMTALDRYKTLVQQVDAYNKSFIAAEAKFNSGVGTSVDYLTAKNNLDRSNINLIQARYDYAIRTKVLDFYQGLKLY